MPDALKAFLSHIATPRQVYTCARLSDGRVIRLSKDCECVTHEGPHFLYMDRVSRDLNCQLFTDRPESISRLAELSYQLQSQQIEQLLTADGAIAIQAGSEPMAA